MGENTKIQWCDFTWNPWVGCTKISDGCDHCYAESQSMRFKRDVWGLGKPRKKTSPDNWKFPLRYNEKAAAEGVRRKVFPSMCDPFDGEVPDEWRDELFAMAAATPHLDWLLLTKRPKLAYGYFLGRALKDIDAASERMGLGRPFSLPDHGGPEQETAWVLPNVWLGVSVEDRKTAALRIRWLREIALIANLYPSGGFRVPLFFVSYEPALEPVDFTKLRWLHGDVEMIFNCLTGDTFVEKDGERSMLLNRMDGDPRVRWLITGGESGPYARRYDFAWGGAAEHQCDVSGAASFHKQGGSNPHLCGEAIRLDDYKGGDPDEWPIALKREFPNVQRAV